MTLGGNPPVEVNPYTDDLIRSLVELRARIRREAADVRDDTERARQLDAIQLGLKIADLEGGASPGVTISC